MLKKITILVVIIVVSVCGFSACKKDKEELATGQAFSLKECYNNGLITMEELKSIAFYHNQNVPAHKNNEVCEGEGFKCDYKEIVAIPKSPKMISAKTEKQILLYYNMHKDVAVSGYYGTYRNKYEVVLVKFPNKTIVKENVVIGGVVFHYNDGESICMWKEKIN